MGDNKLRRSGLYIPGSNPAMMFNAALYGADTIALDLEDSIAVNEKDATRILVRNALRRIDFENTEITVRINALTTPFAVEDLETIIPCAPAGIRLPKAESAEYVQKADQLIGEIEEKNNLPRGSTKLMLLIETANGIYNLEEIAEASSRTVSLEFGAEDYATDLRAKRTLNPSEFTYAREKIVVVARKIGIQALDTVYSDINNDEGLTEESVYVMNMGYDGKFAIHPRQVGIINKVFTPSDREIEHALRVLEAIEEANRRQAGVVSLNGKMIDAPVEIRARKVIEMAQAAGVKLETR
ncbi:MAG: HpcH/HpaI aldolase/citrate lyase family protein [Synergistaceae bacterium]|jgi:citrate lyase subunit beta/citryl-CoA lyase|nr:HpcH/HpaI aldolase/citrate lyase family protein [Synergistaceae bacterium]